MMKEPFSDLKNFIEGIDMTAPQEFFVYDYFPFIHHTLNHLTAKEHDDFVERLFTWSEFHLYTIADFLNMTGFQLKGIYDSGYTFCECFSKIQEIGYLTYLAQSLKIQMTFCRNKKEVSVHEITANLYTVIHKTKDQAWIDHYLELIEDVNR